MCYQPRSCHNDSVIYHFPSCFIISFWALFCPLASSYVHSGLAKLPLFLTCNALLFHNKPCHSMSFRFNDLSPPALPWVHAPILMERHLLFYRKLDFQLQWVLFKLFVNFCSNSVWKRISRRRPWLDRACCVNYLAMSKKPNSAFNIKAVEWETRNGLYYFSECWCTLIHVMYKTSSSLIFFDITKLESHLWKNKRRKKRSALPSYWKIISDTRLINAYKKKEHVHCRIQT